MSTEKRPISPMVITLDHFNVLCNDFTQHYFLSECNPDFGGQEIQVPWDDFAKAVHEFMKTGKVLPHAVALRFVHCYDSRANALYLRMQLCTMSPVKEDPFMFNLEDKVCAWYQLANGAITLTKNTHLFDAEYLDYFYYCQAEECSPATLNNLASDTSAVLYARTVTMPWLLEISQLYIENGLPENAILCIAAGAPFNESAEIQYQHGLVAYLRKADGTPMLDNNIGPLPFHNKAADMGTLCPNDCGVYIIPRYRD